MEPARKRPPDETDADLVSATLSGDRHAFGRLYRRHAESVASVVFRLWGGSTELEDLVQEAMLESLRSLHNLREPQQVGAFMRTIAARVVYDRIRKTQRTRRHTEELERAAQLHGRDEAIAQDVRDLYRALLTLPVKIRVVWTLVKIEGLTYEETAQACGVSVSTTRRWLAQAQRKLERRLADG